MTSATSKPAATVAGLRTEPRRLREVVAELAAHRYTGRRVGTAGGRAAAGWLAAQLRAVGAQVRLEEFPVIGVVREVYRVPILTWPDGATGGGLAFRRDFCEHLASAGLPKPRTGRLADRNDGDVAGAWLLDEQFSAQHVEVAAGRGAAGMLVPRGTDGAVWMPKMIAGPAPVALPVLAVRATCPGTRPRPRHPPASTAPPSPPPPPS